jgi:hypothetical protein
MNGANRDRVRRLFVQATEVLEDAHSTAASGQSEQPSALRAIAAARRLQRAALRILEVANRIEAMLVAGE